MANASETSVAESLKAHYRTFWGDATHLERVPNGPYARQGISDFIACQGGLFFAVECKAERYAAAPFKALRSGQKTFLEAIVKAGGRAFIVAERLTPTRFAYWELEGDSSLEREWRYSVQTLPKFSKGSPVRVTVHSSKSSSVSYAKGTILGCAPSLGFTEDLPKNPLYEWRDSKTGGVHVAVESDIKLPRAKTPRKAVQ